jgi:hypothetical protein
LFFKFFLHYDTCQLSGVDTWQAVRMWTEKLIEVSIPSFLIPHVSFTIQMKGQGKKKKKSFQTTGTNKVFNPKSSHNIFSIILSNLGKI